MPQTVRIPQQLRKLTDNQDTVEVNSKNVAEVFTELQARYNGIAERLLNDKGEVQRFVNVFVNDEDIRFLQGIQTPLKDGDELSIVPAIAGG